jgi:hypothetical protein
VYRVSGLGYRISGFRFQVSGIGFRDSDFEFRVSGVLEKQLLVVDQVDEEYRRMVVPGSRDV